MRRAHRARSLRRGVPVVVALALAFGLAPPADASRGKRECDAARLIAAIEATEGDGHADVINLRSHCTYTLTEVHSGGLGEGEVGIPVRPAVGLPPITEALTINGNGATIRRSSAAGTPAFSIFENLGDLTLRRLTVSGGAAILFLTNTVGPAGGAIVNMGQLHGKRLRVTASTAQALGGDSSGYAMAVGGGIINAGELTLTDSRVDHNSAVTKCSAIHACDDDQLAVGGGLANIDDGSITLRKTRVDHNRVEKSGQFLTFSLGGGIASVNQAFFLRGGSFGILGSSLYPGELHVDRSTVDHNTAIAVSGATCLAVNDCSASVAAGGGISVSTHESDHVSTVSDTTVSHNRVLAVGPFDAFGVGGGIHHGAGSLVIRSSDVHGNLVEAKGTADAVARGGGFGQQNPDGLTNTIITDTSFTDNVAKSKEGTAQGGGMHVQGHVELSGSTVAHNKARGRITQGGGISITDTGSVDINIVDSHVRRNTPDNCFGDPAKYAGEAC